MLFGCLVYSSNTTVIHVARNSGVSDVSKIYGVANPSNGDFGLKNAFWMVNGSYIAGLRILGFVGKHNGFWLKDR